MLPLTMEAQENLKLAMNQAERVRKGGHIWPGVVLLIAPASSSLPFTHWTAGETDLQPLLHPNSTDWSSEVSVTDLELTGMIRSTYLTNPHCWGWAALGTETAVRWKEDQMICMDPNGNKHISLQKQQV